MTQETPAGSPAPNRLLSPMERGDIQKVLPHRDPFLLIDRVIFLSEDRAVAERQIRSEDPVFKGHFPAQPVLPGVLILESLAQTLGVLVLSRPEHRGKVGFFAAMDKVRFRGLVLPGDRLELETVSLKMRKKFTVGQGTARVGDKVVAEAELMLFAE